MPQWFFVSDLHGRVPRYERLLAAIRRERPAAVLLGGDLLPRPCGPWGEEGADFLNTVIVAGLRAVYAALGADYPRVLLILGNDDGRYEAPRFETAPEGAPGGPPLWEYIHARRVACAGHEVYGYSFVPPTPFRLKDWERYDVSRYTDPGCISPEEGVRTVAVPEQEARFATIAEDLANLAADHALADTIWMCHGPPYDTCLDRAALDGRLVEGVPMDVHVGSVALRRFIEERQPLLTLHGHIHESARLTGAWRQQLGRTWCLTGAHDGPELALVRFDPRSPEGATRELM